MMDEDDVGEVLGLFLSPLLPSPPTTCAPSHEQCVGRTQQLSPPRCPRARHQHHRGDRHVGASHGSGLFAVLGARDPIGISTHSTYHPEVALNPLRLPVATLADVRQYPYTAPFPPGPARLLQMMATWPTTSQRG